MLAPSVEVAFRRCLMNFRRYTLTYSPSADRILPPPSHLYVKIRNTSPIPLRAAYLHGPYTLYVACYPNTFNPNEKHDSSRTHGIPEFEPNLKAGGHWTAKLTIPEDIREAASGPRSRQSLEGTRRNVTWIIEVASQVIFSNTATVHYELLIGRDEKSVDLGFNALTGTGHGAPGTLEDNRSRSQSTSGPIKGIYSKAVDLLIEDTEALWNKPTFPWGNRDSAEFSKPGEQDAAKDQALGGLDKRKKRRKRIHLVVLTHGLHSNLGADMLYLKESIDAAAKQARVDARAHKAKQKADIAEDKPSDKSHRSRSVPNAGIASGTEVADDSDNEENEHVIVRGFNGNVVKTEKGIQYLGKRLAKYVLAMTYPDQPFLPVKSSVAKSITRSLTGQKSATSSDGPPAHKHSSIHRDDSRSNRKKAYHITSISFIGHSLGGPIQTYAIAYIQKHSPRFFELIQPINFIAMASPFLGLSNENPIYVKFALDFGLVGRTGQDLGLTWRPPNVVRSGWGAMIGGLGTENQKAKRQADPGAKPLLRILPTGPAHQVLKKFRNRTLYSNVVNDGIVPLRTSCLLFLDWRGLGRVEKARRNNGLVGTMAGWGWAELTGQNASSKVLLDSGEDSEDGHSRSDGKGREDSVPQPAESATIEDNEDQSKPNPERRQFVTQGPYQDEAGDRDDSQQQSPQQPTNPWTGLLSIFKADPPTAVRHQRPKKTKIYRRGQTMGINSGDSAGDSSDGQSQTRPTNRVRGDSLYAEEELQAPPKTTFFESAGDVLNPPLPPTEYLIDPSSRPRTIFHDRVYHPDDIPAAPLARRRTGFPRSLSPSPKLQNDSEAHTDQLQPSSGDGGGMKVEEKIARAYHRDLSWRKVLVRLEPDAHNNMIVRRMFANAYGWPVVKHLVDTHFAYTQAAKTADSEETNEERAKPMGVQANEHGEEVEGQVDTPQTEAAQIHGRTRSQTDLVPEMERASVRDLKANRGRTMSEARESRDEVGELKDPTTTGSSYSSAGQSSKLSRQDSARWSDRYFEDSDDDSDSGIGATSLSTRGGGTDEQEVDGSKTPTGHGTSQAEIADFLSASPPRESSLHASPVNTLQHQRLMPSPKTDANDELSTPSVPGVSGIGLGKSVDKQFKDKPKSPVEQHGGIDSAPKKTVTEHVANATLEKN